MWGVSLHFEWCTIQGLRSLATDCLTMLSFLLLAGCSLIFEGDPEAVNHERCGSLAPLQVDFRSLEQELAHSWAVVESKDMTFSQTEEGVVFSAVGSINSWGWVRSRLEHDLRGSALVVEIGGFSAEFETYISVVSDTEGTSAQLLYAQGELFFSLEEKPQGSLKYEPTRDRVWAIREEAGTLYYETGPTADELVVRGQTSGFGNFVPAHVRVTLGTYGEGEGGAVFRTVNQQELPTNYCATKSLVDSFDGPLDLNQWRHEGESCDYSTSRGSLHLVKNGGRCFLATGRGFNLADSEIGLYLDPAAVWTEGELILSLLGETGASLNLTLGVNNAWMSLTRPDGTEQETAPEPVSDVAHMRIRSEGDTVFWEVESTEGEVTPLQEIPIPIDLNGLTVVVEATGSETTISGVNAK